MAIKSVTNENLAEYVASRPNAASITSSADVKTASEAPTPGKPVIKTGEEKLEGTPDPGPQPTDAERSTKPKKGSLQERLEEQIDQIKTLDEAFQTEYEQRLRLEGELNALKSREQPKEEPKPELGPEPDPTTYTDQKVFLKEWGDWQRKKARAEFQAEEAERRAREETARREAEMEAKVEKAKKDFPDFLQVVRAADARTRSVPAHIQAAFHDSEYGAHLAYYLMKDAAEERRIFSLPVAKALLELGKIEDSFVPKTKAEPTEPVAQSAAVTKPIPAPVARFGEGPGTAPVDLRNTDFKNYKPARLAEIRAKHGRR